MGRNEKEQGGTVVSHWYTQDAKPCHWIEMANGKQRDTTLRDARKLGLYPSVTTIIGLLDKPALNNWKVNQVLLAAMTLPAIENEPIDKFSERVMRDAFKESNDARDRGTLIHDCLEMLVLDKPRDKFPSDIQEIARVALLEVLRYCKAHRQDFISEATVVGDGYGGMIDLHNDEFLIDYKGKDIKDVTAKMAYPEHCMQLAAYDAALGGGRRLINVFIDRTEPGKVVIHEWKHEDAEKELARFRLLVQLWQISKNYYPNQEAELGESKPSLLIK